MPEAQPILPALPYVVTPALRQRLDLLHHLLEFGRQLILVEGPPGGGRSRLLAALAAEASDNWFVIEHNAFEIATPQRLLAAVTAGLGLADGDGEPAMRRLRGRLAERQAAGQVCVLLIDDATELDDACCGLLYELALGGEGELRVVLAGDADTGFAARLSELAPLAAVVHLVEIPPLDLDAAHELYEHVASAADFENPADEADIEAMWQASGGLPGPLITALRAYCQHADASTPLPAAPEAAPARSATGGRRTANLPRKYMWLAALCLIGALAGAFIHYLGARRRNAPATVELTLPAPIGTELAAAPAGSADPDSPALSTADTPASNQTPPREPAAVAEPKPAGADDLDPSAYAVVAADPGDEVVGAPTSVAEPVTLSPPPATPAPAAGPAAGGASAPQVPAGTPRIPTAPATDPPERVEPTPVPLAPAAAEPAMAERPAAPAAVQATPKSAQPAATAKASTPEAKATSQAYTEKWVLTQDAQSYVVQLFASREQAAARRFIAAHAIGTRATVTSITRSGQRWYVVIYGHYPTRAAASQAIAALPTPLVRLKPWPRLVESLKN